MPRDLGTRARLRRETNRISAQHRALNMLYQEIIKALGAESDVRLPFLRFRDALEAHFDLEDRVFFPAIRGLRQHLSEPVADLGREHEEIRSSLQQLEDRLATQGPIAWSQDLERLADAVSGHEAREEQLLEPFRSAPGPHG